MGEAAGSGPPALRVAAIGDLHVGRDEGVAWRELFAEASREADVLVLAGDLTDLGKPSEARLLVEELRGCTLPVVAVLGNHDYESGEVEEVAGERDALGVHDVELGVAEGRGDLVLDDLHPRPVAGDLDAVLDRLDAPDVEPHRRVELQRPPTRRRLRRAEHDPDLLPQLVDEDADRVRLVEVGRQLAQRLRHQPRLQAHLRLAHLALDFRFRHQRRHRVDDDDVHAVGADQDLDDLERLLAVIGLRHQQVLQIHAQLLRVGRVERVLGVDERRRAALLLNFRDDLQGQRRLARRLGPVDLDDAAARQAADAEREVEAERARRHDLDVA